MVLEKPQLQVDCIAKRRAFASASKFDNAVSAYVDPPILLLRSYCQQSRIEFWECFNCKMRCSCI